MSFKIFEKNLFFYFELMFIFLDGNEVEDQVSTLRVLLIIEKVFKK